MAFTLPDLPYAENALEPSIDAQTMNIHHTKHHAAYIAKLNAAIEGTDLAGKTIEELCSGVKNLPADVQGAVPLNPNEDRVGALSSGTQTYPSPSRNGRGPKATLPIRF